MNEEWVHGRPNPVAVRTGQVETARVITAAATIMICVFLTFSFMGSRDVAEFGIGLAAAVALDAFILRTVLVPAAVLLFGDANWWLPRWLDRRLPHLAIEPQSPRQPHPSQPPPSVKGCRLMITKRKRLLEAPDLRRSRTRAWASPRSRPACPPGPAPVVYRYRHEV